MVIVCIGEQFKYVHNSEFEAVKIELVCLIC